MADDRLPKRTAELSEQGRRRRGRPRLRWEDCVNSYSVTYTHMCKACSATVSARDSSIQCWISQSNWTGVDRPCLLWLYRIYLSVYLNKTCMKLEVQMRGFIWNINTNPFPQLITAYSRPTVTASGSPSTGRLDRLAAVTSRSRSKFFKLTDRLWISSTGNYSSNVGSSSE